MTQRYIKTYNSKLVKDELIQPGQNDWLTELRFNVPLDTTLVTSEMMFPANLSASTEKRPKWNLFL